jgi:DNA-binding LytR/AlgR family response regulator
MRRPKDPVRDLEAHAVRASWIARWPVVWTTFRTRLSQTLKPMPFVLAALAGLFLAYLAPFGSGNATMAQRYVYWPAVILGGTLIGLLISCMVDALFDHEQRRPIVSTLLTATVLTPPGALFVTVVTRAVFTEEVMSYASLLRPVFLLSLAMSGLNHLAERRSNPQPSASARVPDASRSVEVRFLERLPFRLKGAEIYAVQAEDHYLRVHTSRGSDLILMRLSDAVAELDGIDGAQTHRSWWVARGAIADVRRGDGHANVVLSNGIEAPVSRSALPILREKGWL